MRDTGRGHGRRLTYLTHSVDNNSHITPISEHQDGESTFIALLFLIENDIMSLKDSILYSTGTGCNGGTNLAVDVHLVFRYSS